MWWARARECHSQGCWYVKSRNLSVVGGEHWVCVEHGSVWLEGALGLYGAREHCVCG